MPQQEQRQTMQQQEQQQRQQQQLGLGLGLWLPRWRHWTILVQELTHQVALVLVEAPERRLQ